MNEFLQIVGSLASIVGIPLAIYLYLKGQAEKYFDVRRDIVKRLSYQVGESRVISIFELNAVIDSLVREKRLKQASISANSIVEDLIAETISSPLLDKCRKDSLVVELRNLHSKCKIYEVIESDETALSAFEEHIRLQNPEVELLNIQKVSSEQYNTKEPSSNKRAEVFGIAASAFFASIAIFYSSTIGGSLVEILSTISIEHAAMVGGGIATLAGFVAGFADKKKKN